jgi:hypothetical protein
MIILVGGEKGLSVIEIEPSGKATNEIRGLVDEMLINKKGTILMSLPNLKKKSTRSKVKSCSVNRFINNAENYAAGADNVISITAGRSNNTSTIDPCVVAMLSTNSEPAIKGVASLRQPFRKSTFTLSEQCINSLTLLSQQSG